MCKYDKRIAEQWNDALAMYVNAVFVSMCAYFSCLKSVQIIERRINLSDTIKNAFECIIDSDDEIMVMMMGDDDRGGPVERKIIRKITG